MTRPVVLTLLDVHRPFLVSPVRKPNYRFGLAEACWILAGSDDAELIGSFNRNMLSFSDDGKRLWGAYGPRLVGQLAHVVSTLRRDPDSRQAVVTTWRPQVASVHPRSEPLKSAGVVASPDAAEHLHPEWDGASWRSRDVPCTVAWHFQLRAGLLNLTVLMRSNDVWLGLPYDLLSFTTVQRVVASMLGVEPGEYSHVVSNLHLYDSNLDQAMAVAEEPPGSSPSLPSMGRTFYLSDVKHVSSDFRCLITDAWTACAPSLVPFMAAIKREPERSPEYLELQRAIHRGGRKPSREVP